jgi:UDP-3-O-[3-hydroxymyristoyl] glucosamine N-acyltransferase
MVKELTLRELAARLKASVAGDENVRIHGVAGIREAREGEITFLANPRYAPYLKETRASAVIMSEAGAPAGLSVLLTPEPYLAFLETLRLFDSGPDDRPPAGIDTTAVVDPTARLGEDVAVGPLAVICAGAEIGERTVLSAGTYIGPGCVIGADCLFYPRVVVRKESRIGDRVIIHAGAVIGDDGFGFAPDGEEYRKIPQLGRVVIEDDVEIGANTTIDRATTGVTRIGRGSRLDNLVMIAHNVEVGENTIICAQVGISGSTRVGRHVTLAGQVGIVGHVEIGDFARVGAQGGVTKSVPPGESYSGYPAQSHVRASRIYASMRNLPEALRALRQLERRVQELERRASAAGTPAGDTSEGEVSDQRTENT